MGQIEIDQPECEEHEVPMDWIGGGWLCHCCLADTEWAENN